MQVHRDLNHLPEFRNAVITIGTFDGVHAGHRFIIQQLEQAARDGGGETVIITFDPHPREVLLPRPDNIRL
jgi:cytidyltransferase-like protein